jgi:uncharacterized protein (DUF952 family)/mannose-6-phosphate isomerase-like protein (cupin superfamily)
MTKYNVFKTDPFCWNGLTIRDITPNVSSLPSFAHIEINPLSSHVITCSKKSEKYYYVLSGQLHFYLNGADFVLSKDEFCIVPSLSKFAYANRSNVTAEILLIHTPKFDIEQEVFEGDYFKNMNIYHVIDETTYNSNITNGYYSNPSVQTEGFIHFCDFNLLNAVANHYYKNETDLIILEVNPSLIESKLKYEDLHNDGIYYPHVYGPLNLNVITRIIKTKKNNGVFNPENEFVGKEELRPERK